MTLTAFERFRAPQPEGGPTRIAVIQRIVPETPESSTYWMGWRGSDGEG